MKIWRVSYQWEDFIDKVLTMEEKYTVIAADPNEAQEKARQLLESSPNYQYCKPKDEDIDCSVSPITGKKISFPRLSLNADKENYTISARLQGSQLEFIVSKK